MVNKQCPDRGLWRIWQILENASKMEFERMKKFLYVMAATRVEFCRKCDLYLLFNFGNGSAKQD